MEFHDPAFVYISPSGIVHTLPKTIEIDLQTLTVINGRDFKSLA